MDANQEKERVHLQELVEKIEKLMAVNHAQERLEKLAWEAQNQAQASTSRPFPLHIDTKEARYGTYHIPTPPVFTKSVMEEVVITDAYPAEYKIIKQVIDNQRLKDTEYDLTRQFYRERGIEYAMDYYDYLVDYDKWADWFKAQKNKNLKESKVDKNPTENAALKDSQVKNHLAMITQEDSVAETIKKVGLEKLLSIGEIKYYGDLTEAFNEEIAETLLYKGAIYPTSPREEKALKE